MTLHRWVDALEATKECLHCHMSSWDHPTVETCEEWRAILVERHEKKERRHAPTEAAWAHAREVLSKEEWALMELDRYPHSRPYRVRDIIVV